MTDAISPFVLNVPQAELEDLAARLARVRFPDSSPVEEGRQGPPLARLDALVGLVNVSTPITTAGVAAATASLGSPRLAARARADAGRRR